MDSSKRKEGDAFLGEMTFAQMDKCDCDECGLSCALPPPSIQAAIMNYKKMKPSPTQERTLIKRYGGVSIWKIAMPLNSQPLTEFGNSHRFLYYKTVPQSVCVKSIGQGVVGSKSETDSRLKVDWKEGSGSFCCANGGKAIGFVSEAGDDTSKTDENMTVVYYALKATQSSVDDFLQGDTHPVENNPNLWNTNLLSLFKKHLASKDTKLDEKALGTISDMVATFENEDQN